MLFLFGNELFRDAEQQLLCGHQHCRVDHIENGVNDSDACADELSKKLRGIMCHVNLIPANPVKENSFKKPDMNKIIHFKERLIKNGINATVRRTLGADIDASCGQLRRKVKEGVVQ